MPSKRISILGVTGSIGQSTADVVLAEPGRFDVGVVTAQRDVQGLVEAAIKLKANVAVIGDEAHYGALREALSGSGIEARAGRDAIVNAVSERTEITVSAITGMAGLEPLLAAMKVSKVVAIANKEPLVAAGDLVKAQAAEYGCTILPIDSEHNAVYQVFENDQREAVEKIILTASGGPFLRWGKDQVAAATPEQALKHPTWSMGRKISIDSATMMNKALEVIEAQVLFEVEPSQIDVLIHPQSIVHSMVSYKDGSVLAQLGASDMRTPISYCLGWPERMATPGEKLDLAKLCTLNFEPPDYEQFPALKLAYDCLSREEGSYALAMNAANEVAVEAFLAREISFPAIVQIIQNVLESHSGVKISNLPCALEQDRVARAAAKAYISKAQSAA